MEGLGGKSVNQLNFVCVNKIISVTFEFIMSHLLDGDNQVRAVCSVAFVSQSREDQASVASKARLDLDAESVFLFILVDFSVVRNNCMFVFQFFSRSVVHFE